MRVILILALLLPLPALASDWTPFEFSFSKGEIYAVDKASIFRMSDGHVRIWFKTIDVKKQMACECKDPKTKNECLAKREKECPGGGSSNYEQRTLYQVSCTGQIRTLSDEKTGDWSYIKPDTLGEDIEKIACNQ